LTLSFKSLALTVAFLNCLGNKNIGSAAKSKRIPITVKPIHHAPTNRGSLRVIPGSSALKLYLYFYSLNLTFFPFKKSGNNENCETYKKDFHSISTIVRTKESLQPDQSVEALSLY
jgi:hypothetical protein